MLPPAGPAKPGFVARRSLGVQPCRRWTKPLVDRAESRATLANISFVAAGVTGALTLYLLLTSSDGGSSQTAAALTPTRGGAMAGYHVSF